MAKHADICRFAAMDLVLWEYMEEQLVEI